MHPAAVPLPRLLQYPEADILTSSDHLRSTGKDEGLELWPEAGSAANIGIMLFRPSAVELAKVSKSCLASEQTLGTFWYHKREQPTLASCFSGPPLWSWKR